METGTVYCSICRCLFDTHEELHEHVMIAHDDNQYFLCDPCRLVFFEECIYFVHMYKYIHLKRMLKMKWTVTQTVMAALPLKERSLKEIWNLLVELNQLRFKQVTKMKWMTHLMVSHCHNMKVRHKRVLHKRMLILPRRLLLVT